MKKQKFLLGAAGLLALGLTACSNEMPVPENSKVEKDQTRFLAVQVASPRDANTRGFNQGTQKEGYVQRLDFFFYDTEGNPTSSPQVLDNSDWKDEDFATGPFEDGNVTRIYKSVVPVELTQGQVVPSQVLCIVNSNESNIQNLSSMTLEQIRDYSTAAFSRDGNFLMSNSVYYGVNDFTGAIDRLCATPINSTSQLFTTEEAAQKVIDGAADAEGTMVDIYVERVAAKVGLTIPEGAEMSYTLKNAADGNDITLKFVPEYWLMNATDTENFITKHYGVEKGDEIIYTPTYTEINDGLSKDAVFVNGEYKSGGANWTTWDDPNNHRSYWGNSPSYFKNDFPFCSDQVNDLDGYTKTYPVKYYSYQDMVTNLGSTSSQAINKQGIAATNGTFTAASNGESGYIYTRETTTPGRTIRDIEQGNPAATVASAVIVGRYSAEGATANASFWVDRNHGVNDETKLTVGTYYATEGAAKQALIDRQVIVFTTDEAGEADENILKDASKFVIAHPKKAVRDLLANPNIAGRLVALQLAAVPVPTAYYYTPAGEYEPITQDNINDVNMQLITAGYMDFFNTGLAFFSIPIRHLNWGNNQTLVGTDYPLYANGQYNWNAFITGSLGVVRNHIYDITVDNIRGLGNALRDPNQPIVPAKDAVNQYIAMRLNILSWNVVPAWSMDL